MAPRRVRIILAVIGIWVVASLYYHSWHPNPWKNQVTVVDLGQIPSKHNHEEKIPQGNGASQPITRWKKRPVRFPPESQTTLPSVKSSSRIPSVQATKPKEDEVAKEVRLKRLAAVKESFLHSWNGYKRSAWLHDEMRPLSGAHKDPFGGWAATLVDSLDTLWIMGLTDEFEAAVDACQHIDFATTTASQINVFETTIRYLGGLLSAYELSEKRYPVLLSKAFEVADMLMSVFDTPNHMPVARWNWKDYVLGKEQKASGHSLVAEIGSMNMEFTKMSELTGDMRFYDAVQRVMDQFDRAQQSTYLPGMWPIAVDTSQTPIHFGGADFTLGGMADSLYEYFPKQYLLLGGAMAQPRRMYEGFIDVAKTNLLRRALNPENVPISFFIDARVLHPTLANAEIETTPRGQHLTCFAGGMVGLASKVFERPQDLAVAEQLTDGCVWSYNITQSGIGPETFTFVPCDPTTSSAQTDCRWTNDRWYQALWKYWRAHGYRSSGPDGGTSGEAPSRDTLDGIAAKEALPLGLVDVNDRRYMLRPEAVESVFMMHRLTGNPKWAESAWNMFSAIDKHTRSPLASAALEDVTRPAGPAEKATTTNTQGLKGSNTNQVDSMESFWTAETLKYFYLIFSEWDVVDLDKWVLNTEAHPLRRADA